MSTRKNGNRYDEEFKKTLVSLYNSGTKSQVDLSKEYGISYNAITRWIKLYSPVQTDNGEFLTGKEIRELRKRNAQLEEEIAILKKAIAIFTPCSNKD